MEDYPALLEAGEQNILKNISTNESDKSPNEKAKREALEMIELQVEEFENLIHKLSKKIDTDKDLVN